MSVPGVASTVDANPPKALTTQDEFVIEPGRVDRRYWRDVWEYRELFYILSWRDISVRYKQTVIGVAWAVLQPLLTMVIMTLIFSKLARLPSEGNAPYALMVFTAMLPWQFFASSLGASGQSLVLNANLISKVYFPRIIVPGSAIVVSLVDLCFAFLVLAGMMAWYQFWPGWRLLALPLFVALAPLTVLGPALLISALNVRFRDFRYVIPFIIQVGLYISPVGYSSALVRERLGDAGFVAYCLNPMVGVIDGFRWAILGESSQIWWPGFALSLLPTLLFLAIGVGYFRRTEKTFADVI
jgi:lipopolysaccharide transport system permease protein